MTIGGKKVKNLATRVLPEDEVAVDGRLVSQKEILTVALHKPVGYVTTAVDPQGRPTVYDLLPPEWNHLRYVGRLDKESSGLLILTSDGDLAQELAHPRHGAEKEYEVRLNRAFRQDDANKMLEGIHLDEGLAKAEGVEIMSRLLIRIVLKQGWKRQIRRMLKELGFVVKELLRFRVGELELRELRSGKWQVLSETQVALLKKKRVGR